MGLFSKKDKKPKYNSDEEIPVIRCSICTGEKTAGFKNKKTGKIKEVMLIECEQDLTAFKIKYGIKGDIEKVYWANVKLYLKERIPWTTFFNWKLKM